MSYKKFQVSSPSNQSQYTYRQQNPQYQGEPLDRDLANGPRQQGKIRDCLFLLLYLAFWAGLIVIAIIAFHGGHPHLLAAPFDSTGQQCGYSPGYQSFPYGYYQPSNHSKFVCIDSCPPTNTSTSSNCIWNNTIYPNCTGIGITATVQIVTFCFPKNAKVGEYADLGLGFFQKLISDLHQTWILSLAVLFISLIVSVGFLFFIRAFGGCLVWTFIVLYLLVLAGFGIVCFLTADNLIDINNLEELKNPELLQIIAYVCWAVFALSLLVVCCSLSKIRVAATVIKTTADFTRQQCQTIFVPLVMFFMIALFFAFWITVSTFIFSSGQVTQCSGSPYACIDWDVGVKRSLGYYFFGLFWNCEMAIGMCQFVLASTCAYWYFGHLNGGNNSQSSPVCRSFCRAIFYHLGSIALGSLILAILWMLQLTLQVLHYASKKSALSTDPVTNACYKCCISYLRCTIACFERFIRFISRNAFIMMALTGEGFCTSAHQGFYLVMRSSREYAISHGVGYLIMFFGKLCISAISTICGYMMLVHIQYFDEKIYSPFMPTLMFFIISFVIGSLFMDIFAIGSDTLLLCYCLQMDVMRGLSYACPQGLKRVIDDGYRK